MTLRSFSAALFCLALAACGGDDKGPSGSNNNNDGDDDNDDQISGAVGDIEDGLSPSKALTIPGRASAMAAAILDASDFNAAYAAVLDALAEGGIATGYNGTVTHDAVAPATTMTMWPINAIDLTLEASSRKTMYTQSLAEFATMLGDYGFPYPDGVAPSAFWVKFLADWYNEAAKDPEAKDSFAVLFIAAMNNQQIPRANIATGTENPSLIRLSVLEMDLLTAAFERSITIANVEALRDRKLRQQSQTPCADLVQSLGVVGQAGNVVAQELTGQGIEAALKSWFSEGTSAAAGTVISALGIAAKINKVVQQMRHGYIKVALDGPTTVRKPLKSQSEKPASLTATAGVDAEALAQAEAESGGTENSEQLVKARDCMSALGIPTPADIREVANDANNWRVQFSIIQGGGSQVLWKRGEQWDIVSRYEKKLVRASESTAKATANFDILQQATDATVGKERERKAVFKVKLHRGSAPDLGTAWGAGKAGFAGAGANTVAAALGISDVLVDIVGKWILESASPTAQVTQNLIEIQPTGLVGTVEWTIEGSRTEHTIVMEDDYENESARVFQQGHIEIISQTQEGTTAQGGEACAQEYLYKTQYKEHPEAGDIVGIGWDRSATMASETWESDTPADQRWKGAEVVNWDATIGQIPAGFPVPPELEASRNTISIYVNQTILCMAREGRILYWVSDANYSSTNGWETEEDATTGVLMMLPHYFGDGINIVKGEQQTNHFTGERSFTVNVPVNGFTVPVQQTVKWNLKYIE